MEHKKIPGENPPKHTRQVFIAVTVCTGTNFFCHFLFLCASLSSIVCLSSSSSDCSRSSQPIICFHLTLSLASYSITSALLHCLHNPPLWSSCFFSSLAAPYSASFIYSLKINYIFSIYLKGYS